MPDHLKFKLFNALPNFAKLTHLAIKNSRHLPGTTSDIFMLIRFCPNLASFKIASEFAPVFTTYSPIDYPNTNLKILDLQFPCMSSAYFKYFVTHLADYLQLETVNIHLYEQIIYHWIKDSDLDTLLQFAKIMTRSTKSCNIQMSSFDHKFRRQVTEPVIEAIMNDYWRLIHELKQDRILHFIIATQTYPDEINYTCHSNQMVGNAVCLSEGGYQVWPYMNYKIDASSKQSNIGPHIVNSLYFENVPSEKAIITLLYALTNYTHLDYLSICFEAKYHKPSAFFALDSTFGARLSKATLHYCKDISEKVLTTIVRLVPQLSEIMWTEQSLRNCGQFNMPADIKHLKTLSVHFADGVVSQSAWCLYLLVNQNRKPFIYKSANIEGYPKKRSHHYNFLPSSALQMSNHFHGPSLYTTLPTILIVNAEKLDELVLMENGSIIENLCFASAD